MKIQKLVLIAVVTSIICSSCATIFGGRNYNAIIKTNRPNAEITVNNQYIGTGNGTIIIPRKDANKLNITLHEEGCEDTVFNFSSRKIRGVSLAVALAPSTIIASYLTIISPLNNDPMTIAIGAILSLYLISPSLVDIINFSTMYKPDIKEAGVYKINYKNYEYRLQSTCITNEPLSEKTVLNGTVYLKNGSIIKGQIVEIVPNKSIKLQTIDGSVLVFSFEDIEKYTQE